MFSNDDFRHDVISELSKGNIHISSLEDFIENLLKVLNKMAPDKNRYIRSNQAHF